MSLDSILRQFNDEAAGVAYLESCGDGRLLSRVREIAAAFEESPAQYAAAALRRYANLAGRDEWLSLMTALGASEDPGRACMVRVLDWALLRDAAELRHTAPDCARGGPETRA